MNSVAISASRSNISRGRARLAAAAAAAAIALGPPGLAEATTYFTGTASAGSTFSLNDQLFNGFSFNYYGVVFRGGCSSCITATAADGSALGTFNFAIGGSPWSYLQDPLIYPQTTTQGVAPGGSYEHFEGYGNVDILAAPYGVGPSLLGGGGNFDAFSIYATPGSSTATIEFDLDQYATSGLITLPSVPLYLQITASTASPVTLTNLTPDRAVPVYSFTTPMVFDFTVALSDTRFSPSGGGSLPGGDGGGGGIPEPATWTMLLAGFAATGAALRRRRRSLSAVPA
ncbi:MAG: hypothetical protein JWR43_2353 [Phenylobacterium sp.]|nr:hypothetical protein [Phenylobacterium sp.]